MIPVFFFDVFESFRKTYYECYGFDLSHYVSVVIVPFPQKQKYRENRIFQPRNYHFWNFWWERGEI